MIDSTAGSFSDYKTLARLIDRTPMPTSDPIAAKRRLLAEFCRFLASRLSPPAAQPASRVDTSNLSPRLAQTLQCLLDGLSEKEAAAALGVSRHTVHVYVRSLYRRFDVNSRSELLARFVAVRVSA